jgi:hypothetical protein
MRQFDVVQANRLVPYLSAAFTKVRAWADRAKELTTQLDALGDPGSAEETAVTSDPLAPIRRERDEAIEGIRRELSSISAMGIEVKSVEGLVDFRATLDGRTVYLCWQFGEQDIRFWHELDGGFRGRQAIHSDDAFAPSYLS